MTEAERQTAYLEAHDGSFIYGITWGTPEIDIPCIFNEWISPQLTPDTVALEIGSGGGRWSRYFRWCKLAYLVDATAASERLIRGHCDSPQFRFLLSPDGMLPDIPARSVSYAFSFDTFVHFDQPLFDAYLSEIARVLKPGGVFHLHYAQRLTESQSEEFRYREPGELFELTTRLGFTTGKRWFRGDGWGSVMVELTKAHPPHQPLA